MSLIGAILSHGSVRSYEKKVLDEIFNTISEAGR